jgi:hypothetical protein
MPRHENKKQNLLASCPHQSPMDPTGSLSKGFSALSVGDQNTPHDDKDTTPSLTRVSPKRDLFTDEDHNKLDAYVIKTFSLNRRYNEQPPLDALLTYITVEDKRLVTLTSEDAQELLDSHPSVGVVLQKAWRENNFKEVRQLGEFLLVTTQRPLSP